MIKNKRQVVSRYYNQISFKGDRVIKGVPKDRFVKEIEWFNEAQKRIPNNIPHVFDHTKENKRDSNKELKYYEMQAIDGDNLYQLTQTNRIKFPKIFNKLILLTKKMHREVIKPKKSDIFQMYFLKPNTALVDFVEKTRINPSSITINSQRYTNPIAQLKDTYYQLESKLLKTNYSFIHGDLTMSNTLVDSAENIYLIDPRGVFGQTKYFGDVRYDIAKLYYSIVGNFDSLNVGKFKFKNGKGYSNNYYYSIDDNGLKNYEKTIVKEFNEQITLIRFIHATIWLSLIPHTNNFKQQWCTFCNGVQLLNTIYDHENE
jgi:hypothetical protein